MLSDTLKVHISVHYFELVGKVNADLVCKLPT